MRSLDQDYIVTMNCEVDVRHHHVADGVGEAREQILVVVIEEEQIFHAEDAGGYTKNGIFNLLFTHKLSSYFNSYYIQTHLWSKELLSTMFLFPE